MIAFTDTGDCFEDTIDEVEVNDRAIELAMELAAEGADDETIDEFLDNCEEPWEVLELLAAIAQGEIEQEEDGTFYYRGDEVTVGVGHTREEAALAYVTARMNCC